MLKKLYRSRNDRMIAGVCGGLAKYFGIDSTIVRIAAFLLIVPGGLSIWVYIAMALIIPLEPEVGSPHLEESNIYEDNNDFENIYRETKKRKESEEDYY